MKHIQKIQYYRETVENKWLLSTAVWLRIRDNTQISHPAPLVIRGCPTWTPAKWLQLAASLNGTRSSRSVISAAPPAAIVHPVGPACVKFFYYTLTRSCCLCFLWHRAHSYRSVFTEPLQDIKKCPNRQLKLTTELEDWCFSTQSGVKCIRSSQNTSESRFSQSRSAEQICTDGRKDIKILALSSLTKPLHHFLTQWILHYSSVMSSVHSES